MPTTSNFGLRYPSSTSAVNVNGDIQNLASDVDVVLGSSANVDIFNSVGGSALTLTSASYVDITSASKSFTKTGASADSDLIVLASLSAWSSATATIIKIGVNVNGVDSDVITFPFNAASVHTTLPTGAVRITGLAAGTYTVKLRALRVSGTGTVTVDTQDTVTMIIQERAK